MTGYPSIDKPWLKYFTDKALASDLPACTVYRNIYNNNKDHLDDIAIRYYGNDISYKTMFDKVEKCAKSLCQVGINEGDCVTLCTAGAPEAIYMVFACSKIGAIANFINPLFTKDQMIDRINDTEAEWIFVLDEMFSFVEQTLPETCIKKAVIIPVYNSMAWSIKAVAKIKSKTKKIIKQNHPYEVMVWDDFELIGDSYSSLTEVPYIAYRPTIMVYSSGSTGASKGILLSNDSANAVIDTFVNSSFDFRRGDIFLQMIPIWFSTGIVFSILMPLAFGMIVVPELKFSKETFANDLIKYKPSITLTATSLWLYVMKTYDTEKMDLSNMKYPTSGGEKILPQDERLLNEFLTKHGCKKKLYKGYGMCELGSEATGNTDCEIYHDKLGGCGYPMKNVIVSAFDIETNKELKYGEHGEIRVNTPARMNGYFKNQKATDEFFHVDEDGKVWGCTGDIGYVDEEGEVFILGRATDRAKLDNGKTVYLFDIEDCILQEKSLTGCKVVENVENGKTVLAAHMTLRNDTDYDKVSLAKQIYENCKKNLPSYEVPRKYKFRDSFPVHTNGKRDNNALKQEKDGFYEFE